MAADDERARKIAEAKARADAVKAARGGAAAQPVNTTPAEPAPMLVASDAPVGAQPAAAAAAANENAVPAAPVAGGEAATLTPAAVAAGAAASAAAEGTDDRARKIAEAKARAESARAARGGATAPIPASASVAPGEPVAEASPPAVTTQRETAASATPAAGASDDRAQRIEEAKARATAAGAARTSAPAATAQPATAAALAPVAPRPTSPARAAAVAPTAVMVPAGDWKGVANAPNRVLTARADTRAIGRRKLESHEAQLLMTRRSLVRTSFWAGLGVTVAGLLLGFLQFFWPRKVVGFGGVVQIPASAVPKPGEDPKRIFEGKLYLVNLKPGEGVPDAYRAIAPPSEKGGILALWQKCPHLGCTVPWRPEFDFEGVKAWFRCPCHGSTYTKAGIRVAGPAPRPMDTFLVKVNGDGSVSVDTSKITKGGPDNPQRAVLA